MTTSEFGYWTTASWASDDLLALAAYDHGRSAVHGRPLWWRTLLLSAGGLNATPYIYVPKGKAPSIAPA